MTNKEFQELLKQYPDDFEIIAEEWDPIDECYKYRPAKLLIKSEPREILITIRGNKKWITHNG